MAYIEMKPRVQVKTGYNAESIALDGGVNRHGTIFNILANEAWDCRNTTSKVNGALSVRPNDRAKFTKRNDGTNTFSEDVGVLALNSYTSRPNNRDMVNIVINDPDDSTKYYLAQWDKEAQLSSDFLIPYTKDIFQPEVTIISYQTDSTDYTIVCSTKGVYEKHGSDPFTLIENAPKTSLYTIDDYRLFALKGNKLSWCDPEDLTKWSTGDAGEVIFSDMKGTGTAIITFNDAVICFSGKTMHILYGDDSGNYEVGNIINSGCVGYRAIAKTKDAVYFLGFDGLKVYSNGSVDVVSEKIDYWLKEMNMFDSAERQAFAKTFYSHAAMGIDGDYLYLSIPYNSINNSVDPNDMTFEINLRTGVINIFDVGYKAFTKVDRVFYGLKDTGLYEIGTNPTHSIQWYHETPMRRAQFNKQTVSQIPVLVDLPSGSTLKLAYNINDKTPNWIDLHTFEPKPYSQEVFVDIPITMLNNAAMYQLKFYGTGPCTIHEVGIDGRVKIR